MTRRAAVGLEARVRLCEARDHHVTGTALGDSDPTAALRHLRTADALAYQARTLAQQDEAAWLNTRRMSAGIGELDSVLLGGILIEAPLPCPGTTPAGLVAALDRPASAARHPGAARRAWPSGPDGTGRGPRRAMSGAARPPGRGRGPARAGRAHIGVREGQAQPTSLSIASSALAKTTAAAV